MTWRGPCGVSAVDASSVNDSRSAFGRSYTTAFRSRTERDRGAPHVEVPEIGRNLIAHCERPNETTLRGIRRVVSSTFRVGWSSRSDGLQFWLPDHGNEDQEKRSDDSDEDEDEGRRFCDEGTASVVAGDHHWGSRSTSGRCRCCRGQLGVRPVAFTPGSTLANVSSTWTVGFTTVCSLGTGSTITATLPSNFRVPRRDDHPADWALALLGNRQLRERWRRSPWPAAAERATSLLRDPHHRRDHQPGGVQLCQHRLQREDEH